MGQRVDFGLASCCFLLFFCGVQGRLISGLKSNHTGQDAAQSKSQLIDSRTYLRNIRPLDDATHTDRWEVYKINGPFFGSKARLNLWGPSQVQPDQITAISVWIVGGLDGPPDHINVIQAGYHVYPQLYNGDTRPHFFISWTVDTYQKSGCYNLNCDGFVYNTSTGTPPGSLVEPMSIFNGQQHYLPITITKDRNTGNWELLVGDDDNQKLIGYWPRSLFTNLQDHGSQFAWGGIASSNPKEGSPPMGSGQYAVAGEGRAASVKNIQLQNDYGQFINPETDAFVPGPNDKTCYGITEVLDHDRSGNKGDNFYLGGPGGCAS